MYLDNAATTVLSDKVKDHIISILDSYGNPSSLYGIGAKSKTLLTTARKRVAKFINANVDEIYFTSSGSASNVLAIKGYVRKHNCHVLYSPIAHKSILKTVEDCQKKTPLSVNRHGSIDLHDLKKKCNSFDGALVVVDYANSEIGTIQNIKKIIDIVHSAGGTIYVDCTASISSVPINVEKLDVDMCGFSGHKIGALKGCGAFYKKDNINIDPLIYGSQEDGLFGGTENILGISSLGVAVSNHDYSLCNSLHRDYIASYISKNISDCYIVGDAKNRLCNHLLVCFEGVDSESLMFLLDLYGIQVSTGSECNIREVRPSVALQEIGLNKKDLFSCVRITLNGRENYKDLKFVCEKIKECVDYLRDM